METIQGREDSSVEKASRWETERGGATVWPWQMEMVGAGGGRGRSSDWVWSMCQDFFQLNSYLLWLGKSLPMVSLPWLMAERIVIIKKTPGDRLAPSGQSIVQSAGLLESQAAGEFPRALSLPAGNPGVTPTLSHAP